MYRCDQTNPLEQNFFLNNLKAGLSDQQKEHLQNDLSEFEIETAISQMAKGKVPGPDGLSVEFYTQCWPIVKNDFVNLLNQMYFTQTIDNRTKSGFITLIYKKGPKTKISNYRPISLLNYDLKIFTKCLTNRLKPLMTNLSHENQYAKPGKQIFSIANLYFETCGGMHLIENRCVFRFARFQKSVRFDRPALAFSNPSQNEFSHEIHSYNKFIEQGRKCSRPCQWISN